MVSKQHSRWRRTCRERGVETEGLFKSKRAIGADTSRKKRGKSFAARDIVI
jgi:hypothetical protein